MSMPDRLIWTDIETTGLNKDHEVLLEVGFIITDLELKHLDSFHELVWQPGWVQVIDNADKFVIDMHSPEKSALFLDAEKHGNSLAYVGDHLYSWLKAAGVTKEDPLCGSSVQFDREWLTDRFPDSMAMFSHRNIDVSTVKELCKRFNPILAAKLDEDVKPLKMHRSMSDIRDTIEEFRFYRDNFLFWADAEEAA